MPEGIFDLDGKSCSDKAVPYDGEHSLGKGKDEAHTWTLRVSSSAKDALLSFEATSPKNSAIVSADVSTTFTGASKTTGASAAPAGGPAFAGGDGVAQGGGLGPFLPGLQ